MIVLFFKETLCEVIKTTVIKWGRATHINDPNLIREMFKLIYNQYDGIGEVIYDLSRFGTAVRRRLCERIQLSSNPI